MAEPNPGIPPSQLFAVPPPAMPALGPAVEEPPHAEIPIQPASGVDWMRFTMFVLALLLVAGIGYLVTQANLNDFAQGAAMLILGRMLGYMDNMYSFQFNTTRSSQAKDVTIQNLSQK